MMQPTTDDFATKATAYFLCTVIFLLCITLWWKTMKAEDELQMVRAMTERNNELILDIRQEIVAQEKQNRQAFEKLQKSIEGEW